MTENIDERSWRVELEPGPDASQNQCVLCLNRVKLMEHYLQIILAVLVLWLIVPPLVSALPKKRWRARPPRDVKSPVLALNQLAQSSESVNAFNYEEAFSRTLGWITDAELQVLNRSRVAIGGLGGVGGSHALTLARLGVGRFTLADMDTFDWPNMNRQAGCFGSTIGKPKCETLARMLADINPEIQFTLMPNGVDESNIEQFLDGVDLYVDSYDLFALSIRRRTFQRCRELGIPAITAAPVGFGTAFMCFLPDGMSFEEYFDFGSVSAPHEQILKFLLGVSPSMLQFSYLADPSRVNLAKEKVCSTSVGIEMSAGVAAANSIKLLLGRGDVISAPSGVHFDAYRNKLAITWRPWGNKNPIQKILFWVVKTFRAPKD